MYFDSLAAAMSMEGHGLFVWSAYGLTAIALATLLSLPSRRLRQHWRWIEADRRRLPEPPRNPVDDGRSDR